MPIAAGTMDMEAMDELAVGHIEEDDLLAGDTSSVDVTFDKAPGGNAKVRVSHRAALREGHGPPHRR
jgi:hypothetical protein